MLGHEEAREKPRIYAGFLLFRRLILLVIRPDALTAIRHLVPALIAIGVFAARC
jgi:hypothetical protein